ncbi:TIM barrel protein [Oscillospiraceae bacterium OttesenSCG-928-G22]|nr:TIM barrel protein [Oscillospiraceae bacterium OttesenSCG-928-G22]
MTEALFGPAGNSELFTATVSKRTIDAFPYLKNLGLTAYEYQCGNGVHVGKETAEKIGETAKAHGIALSLHSPYFISLTNLDNLEKNIKYTLDSCAAAKAMGATRIVVHTGSATGRDRGEATADALTTLKELLGAMEATGYAGITLCPETMGKLNQLGTLSEVLSLCRADERLLPCVDFGHLYARTHGELDGQGAFAAMLDEMENAIGKERARVFHSHFSKIEYSKGGEKRHMTFDDNGGFGPDFAPLASLVAERGYAPTFICESRGTQDIDAAAMQRLYREAKKALDSPLA